MKKRPHKMPFWVLTSARPTLAPISEVIQASTPAANPSVSYVMTSHRTLESPATQTAGADSYSSVVKATQRVVSDLYSRAGRTIPSLLRNGWGWP